MEPGMVATDLVASGMVEAPTRVISYNDTGVLYTGIEVSSVFFGKQARGGHGCDIGWKTTDSGERIIDRLL